MTSKWFLPGRAQAFAGEAVALPSREEILGLALELVRLVLAVGHEQRRGLVGEVEDGAVPPDLVPRQLHLRLQEGVGERREVEEAADGASLP